MINIDSADESNHIALTIIEGFNRHYRLFSEKSCSAKAFFEAGDAAGEQMAVKERIAYYDERVLETIDFLKFNLQAEDLPQNMWERVKLHFLGLLVEHPQAELAETFFNSVVCRILHRDYFQNKYIFRRPAISLEYLEGNTPTYVSYYPPKQPLRRLIREILLANDWKIPFADMNRDIVNILREMRRYARHELALPVGQLMPEYNCQVQVLRSPFYQNQAAYLFGKMINGFREFPFSMVIRRTQVKGSVQLYVDALILDKQTIRTMFSLSRAYFMTTMEVPSAYVQFLRTIMPNKPRFELYTMLGLGKQGKTAFYRDLIYHLNHSNDSFVVAPGIPGLVMMVFMLPSFPFVFKLIRDKFGSTKQVDHATVKAKYLLVKQVDRVGRMADTLEYSDVVLPINRFDPELLEMLKKAIPSLLEINEETVTIKHVYIERRMKPLNIYITEMEAQGREAELESAIIDYGNAIKELAAANIFPGDMLWKNFGITRYGRVVFYDYDEIEWMTDCNFRDIPECPYPEMELSGEPWYSVGRHDIFPEEFASFLLNNPKVRQIFLAHHRDLLTASYWKSLQTRIREGEVIEHFPYPLSLRFASKAHPWQSGSHRTTATQH